LESQAEICTADIRRAICAKFDTERERPALGWRALETLSWYTSESSTYVIQGVSATVRGQSKLNGEGEPQGVTRQAPEPPDTPQGTWSRKTGADEGRDGLRGEKEEVYISAPLQLIRVLED